MRDVMDEVDPEEIEPAFDLFFRPLQRGKHLEKYRVFDRYYVASIDGSRVLRLRGDSLSRMSHKQRRRRSASPTRSSRPPS